MKHLIDTKPRLAECNRCGAYVFAGMQSGCRFAVDVTPLNSATVRALMITSQESVYTVLPNGKIAFLSWQNSAFGGTCLSAHACGCSALDASAFEELADPPLQAPALDNGCSDVLVGRGLTYSVVQDARPHRSDVVRCAECGVLMDHENMIMVEVPVWQENTHKVPNRGSRKGYTREYKGWGYERWAIHPDGCPALMSG